MYLGQRQPGISQWYSFCCTELHKQLLSYLLPCFDKNHFPPSSHLVSHPSGPCTVLGGWKRNSFLSDKAAWRDQPQMAEDAGAGWFGGGLRWPRDRDETRELGRANGDVGKRLGRKRIYRGREATSDTFTLNWNDFVLIYILTRRTWIVLL